MADKLGLYPAPVVALRGGQYLAVRLTQNKNVLLHQRSDILTKVRFMSEAGVNIPASNAPVYHRGIFFRRPSMMAGARPEYKEACRYSGGAAH
jgi:hypothetical protein